MAEESTPGTITIDDFAKIDLRVATIKAVEEIPKADRLWKLTLDVGELGERTICAGIKEHIPNGAALLGKQIIIVANLAPRTMRGVVSHGMLLAAKDDKGLRCVIPENMWNNIDSGDMTPGTKVG